MRRICSLSMLLTPKLTHKIKRMQLAIHTKQKTIRHDHQLLHIFVSNMWNDTKRNTNQSMSLKTDIKGNLRSSCTETLYTSHISSPIAPYYRQKDIVGLYSIQITKSQFSTHSSNTKSICFLQNESL